MSHKQSSLAFDETLKEHDSELLFEPDLKVIVNEHYLKTSFSLLTSEFQNVVQVKGSITVSF